MNPVHPMVFVLCALTSSLVAIPAFATNGMNFDGYGAVAAGTGGAAQAHDVGASAAMNNPATLTMLPEGSRLDLGVIYVGPSLKAELGGAAPRSTATAFFLPQAGYAYKSGPLAVGLAYMPSGGMGTEFPAESFVAAGSGDKVRSEVALFRVIVPVAYELTPELSLGVTLDHGRAGLDTQLALTGDQFIAMATPGQQTFGTAGGSLVQKMAAALMGGTSINWTRFDFSNDSALTQLATGSGWGGKLGATYKAMPALTVGASFIPAMKLGDLTAKGASVSFNATGPLCGGPGVSCTVPITGEVSVKDFKWPSTFAFGAAYQVTSDFTLVGDYKFIGWKSAMEAFNIAFAADAEQAHPLANGLVSQGGKSVEATMFQRWSNQNVIALGGIYKLSTAWTLRGGINLANNPIPDELVNPLFAVVIKNAVHLGAGYQFSASSGIDASFDFAPSVKATNGHGVTSSLGGVASQLAYNLKF